MYTLSLSKQLIILFLLISSIDVSAYQTDRSDDCDLGNSSVQGYSPWITIEYPAFFEEEESEHGEPRGEGCEIHLNLRQPNGGRDQFAYIKFSNMENYIETYHVNFSIKNIDQMLDKFEDHQSLKFFTLRTFSAQGEGRELLSLVISKPLRSPRSFWKFNSIWNNSHAFDSQLPSHGFAINQEAKHVHFSINWSWLPDGTGRYVNVEVASNNYTKNFYYQDHELTLPDTAALGYIDAQPVLDLGNEAVFYATRPRLSEPE
ncbi:hypothetical protein [Marinicella sp. W31]|uniref:hypothetical protein n=1 Tax=Marinicella sp. W31 TaxID=3023713 RepID=UPI003757CB0F